MIYCTSKIFQALMIEITAHLLHRNVSKYWYKLCKYSNTGRNKLYVLIWHSSLVFYSLFFSGTSIGLVQVFNLATGSLWREYNIHTSTVRWENKCKNTLTIFHILSGCIFGVNRQLLLVLTLWHYFWSGFPRGVLITKVYPGTCCWNGSQNQPPGITMTPYSVQKLV